MQVGIETAQDPPGFRFSAAYNLDLISKMASISHILDAPSLASPLFFLTFKIK